MITIKTGNAQGFLDTIYKAFDEKGTTKGEKDLPTWSCVTENGTRFFTHNPEQWNGKAWFTAYIPANSTDEVRIRIIKPRASTIEMPIYSHYHGRFISMLFSNFGNTFISVTATSLPTKEDDMR